MDENNYERNGERFGVSLDQKEYLHVAYSKERLTSESVPQPLLAHLGKYRSSLAHMNIEIPAFWPLPEHVPRNCWKSLKYQFDETDAKSLSPVLRAYVEVEEPGWRLYDEAFRDKMASTGVRSWSGMDVKVYQEVCGGRSKRRAGGPSVVSSVGWKRPTEGRKQYVCWQFNEGHCSTQPHPLVLPPLHKV